MPSSDNHGSLLPFASFRRSVVSRDQLHSETTHDCNVENLESFQRQVFTRFHDLSAVKFDEFLCISWIQKLLDTLTNCQEDFRIILCNHKSQLSRPPLDRLVTDYFDRAIKALDICNAARDGIDNIRLWQKHLEIVRCALDTQDRMISEGQIRRARKALTDLSLVMLDEKDTGVFLHHNRSIGFGHKGKEHHHRRASGHSHSLSWSVSNTWSAFRQVQLIANHLAPPRANEIAASDGLALAVFTMSFVLMFVLWVLVASIPCQDRGVQIHFTIPSHFSWSAPLISIQNQVLEESKKRDRRNSNGLLKEVYHIEKSVHWMMDMVNSVQSPLTEQQKEEVKESVHELSLVCGVCETELDPLERQLRGVFWKIMRFRTEGLELLGKATEP